MFDTEAYKELFETQEETKHPWSRGMTEDQVNYPQSMVKQGIKANLCPAGRQDLFEIILDGAVPQWSR